MSVGLEAEQTGDELLRLGADIVAAYVSRNAVPTEAHARHHPHRTPGAGEPFGCERRRTAGRAAQAGGSVGRSVQQDFIVCLEDGKRLKMLKRYLRSRFDLSPDDYRRRWGLPPDYPMVAPRLCRAGVRSSPSRSAWAGACATTSSPPVQVKARERYFSRQIAALAAPPILGH